MPFALIKNDKSKSKRDKEQNKIKDRPLCVTYYVKKKVIFRENKQSNQWI